ncbi:MAG TPA: hypothetical protein VFT27_04275 [Actinomycetota bacterium]|nr:hypothetical protein [Actinomycetota bacterium]
MTKDGRIPRVLPKQPFWEAFHAHVAAYVVLGIVVSVLLAVGVLGAPLVSVLLIGVLLVCPLLMWVPFRFEEENRQQAQESFRRARHT